ncbi:MAG: GNAT family N-acetyltransferase [Paracoccaceae bacterium]
MLPDAPLDSLDPCLDCPPDQDLRRSQAAARVGQAPAYFSIRTARPHDFDAVDRLLSRAYPALLRADYDRETLADILPLIARANPRLLASGTYYVAEGPGGALVGAGGWSWVGPQGGVGPADMAHIRHVVTHQDHTRLGIGRALMRHAMGAAKGAGARILHCQSTLTAAPFYRALGFDHIADIELHLCPGVSFGAVHLRAAI